MDWPTKKAMIMLGMVIVGGAAVLAITMGHGSAAAVSEGHVVENAWGERMAVWEDPDTGCQYLIRRGDHGDDAITPRMEGGVLHSVYPMRQLGCK